MWNANEKLSECGMQMNTKYTPNRMQVESHSIPNSHSTPKSHSNPKMLPQISSSAKDQNHNLNSSHSEALEQELSFFNKRKTQIPKSPTVACEAETKKKDDLPALESQKISKEAEINKTSVEQRLLELKRKLAETVSSSPTKPEKLIQQPKPKGKKTKKEISHKMLFQIKRAHQPENPIYFADLAPCEDFSLFFKCCSLHFTSNNKERQSNDSSSSLESSNFILALEGEIPVFPTTTPKSLHLEEHGKGKASSKPRIHSLILYTAEEWSAKQQQQPILKEQNQSTLLIEEEEIMPLEKPSDSCSIVKIVIREKNCENSISLPVKSTIQQVYQELVKLGIHKKGYFLHFDGEKLNFNSKQTLLELELEEMQVFDYLC